MDIRSGSQQGPGMVSPAQAVEQIHALLAGQHQQWADQLAADPASFAQLEPQIHRAFGQLADQLVASLLAHAGRQPALQEQAKKK